MTAAEDATEALRLAREALAMAEARPWRRVTSRVTSGRTRASADERIRLAQEPDGSVGLTIRRRGGPRRMRLGLDKHGHPSVELLGPNGGHAGGIS